MLRQESDSMPLVNEQTDTFHKIKMSTPTRKVTLSRQRNINIRSQSNLKIAY